MNSLTQIPPGTQILIGDAARRRRAVERTLFSVFEGWSYEEIIPPMLDYFDVFVKGMGSELEDRIYRFIDREGNVLALRPEFTSLLAKMAATRLSGEPKPVRLSYSGEVLRFETPKGGQQREFAQMGVEHYGGSPATADVEVLLVCMEALEKLGIEDFQINLGSVDFFGGIVERIDLPEEGIDRLKELLNIKDQAGLEKMLVGLSFEKRRKDILLAIPHLTGGREILARARKLVTNQRSLGAIEHLENIFGIFESLGLDRRLTIDFGEVRGFDYYSGILFRAYVRGLGFEVASGGRYDGLPAQFGHDTPAVGFSFSLDRLEQIVDPKAFGADTRLPTGIEESSFEEAMRLRREGKRVRLCS
jgi:ATP phosphoribosyltransferase regulatory subunit